MFLMFFLTPLLTFGQRTVSGAITSDGQPLIRANVLVKGTTLGTITDVDGKYTTMGDQDRARQILRKERRLELAFESKRFFDLVRWGITEEVLDEYFAIEKVKRPHLIDGNFTSGRDEYMAILEAQITLSQGLYVQNPGYN